MRISELLATEGDGEWNVAATEREAGGGGAPPADKFLLTTHENPDGDALGSLLAMHGSSSCSARTP